MRCVNFPPDRSSDFTFVRRANVTIDFVDGEPIPQFPIVVCDSLC